MRTEAQNRATAKYNKSNYDNINLTVRKDGETSKAIIKQSAEAAGESINGYIIEAIKRRLESEN